METNEQHEGGAGHRYRQELSRSIGVLGNVFITLSGVTPAASVFIIAPVALAEAGSGAFASFVFAALVGVAFSGVLAVTAVAIFSYNGYNSAVNFAEETTGSSRSIARAILWSLVITVAAELIPLTATIVGAPSLAKLTQSAVPMQYFIESTSNSTVYDVLSLGIVLAILNAVIAIILSYARILWSAARDRAFPGPVSGWMEQVHPRWRSPWVATAFIGVLGAVLCLTVSLGTLVNLTGASLVADYALIALAALVARPAGATANSPYKMRGWPLPPLLALASLGYVFTQQTALLLRVTLITMAIGLVYWLAVLLPQRGKAWHLRDAAGSEQAQVPAGQPAAGAV